MTAAQFLNKVESYWKPIPLEHREIYLSKLYRFSDSELDRIFDRLVDACKFLPKIHDVVSAAQDLMIGTSSRAPASAGCDKCKGTTWIHFTCVHPISGRDYQAVKACRCTPRTYKPPHDDSPNSLKTWNLFSGTEKKDEVPF